MATFIANCASLWAPVNAIATRVFCALNNHVNEFAHDQVHPMFLVDEAQLMRDEVLSTCTS